MEVSKMTVRDLIKKVVVASDSYKVIKINGKDEVLTHTNLEFKVKDFRIVDTGTKVMIYIETK